MKVLIKIGKKKIPNNFDILLNLQSVSLGM